MRKFLRFYVAMVGLTLLIVAGVSPLFLFHSLGWTQSNVGLGVYILVWAPAFAAVTGSFGARAFRWVEAA
jgi:hypothetical protein